MDFEWDDDNLRHVLIERPHGVTPGLVRQIARNEPVLVENPVGRGRSGSHKMIGPDDGGQLWTIVLFHRHHDVWRPVTGWRSSSADEEMWRNTE